MCEQTLKLHRIKDQIEFKEKIIWVTYIMLIILRAQIHFFCIFFIIEKL